MTNDLNIIYVDADAGSVVISAPAESPSVFIPESAEPVAVFSNLNAPGAPGPSAYQLALAASPPFVGTEAQWRASLAGAPGPNNITSSTTTDLDGLAKFDGAHVDTATPGVDYMRPDGSGAGLTNLSKLQVGLNLADNTRDTDKPVSTPQQTALDGKIGHPLATAVNDFLVASGAGAFVKKTLAEVKAILGLGSAAYAAVSDLLSPTGNGSGLTDLTKTQVGLGNVQNLDQRDAGNINTGSLDGDRLPALSTTKRGGVPATGTPSGRILSDGDTWVPMGNGDVSSDTVTTVDGEIPLFKGTAGKTIQRASMTGMLKAVAGKLYAAVAATDYVAPNAAIAPGTGTKITYDAKGLVTGSTAATTADFADSNDRRYCTEAQKTIIGNTSGINSGDISKATGAEITTGTDDGKFTTPKAIKDAGIVATPVKATGAEVTTGTDDAKFTTPKAIKDAGIVATNVWNPFLAPTSPHAKDDEFSDSSLDGKWTEWDVGNVITVSELAFGLKMFAQNASGAKTGGIFQTIPTDNWSLTAYLSLSGRLVNYANTGIFVSENIVTNPSTAKLVKIGQSFDVTNISIGTVYLNNYSSYNSDLATAAAVKLAIGVFVRIVKSGTTYSTLYSNDGIGWIVHYSGAIAFTPIHFGININDEGNGGDVQAIVQFFRVTTSTDLFLPIDGRRV